MTVRVPADAKEATISAVVIRSDGRVENLGVVSYWHKHWWMRALHRIKRVFTW